MRVRAKHLDRVLDWAAQTRIALLFIVIETTIAISMAETPTRSCASRPKAMHGHGVANLEGGEVLANFQRAAIGLTCLGDEIV